MLLNGIGTTGFLLLRGGTPLQRARGAQAHTPLPLSAFGVLPLFLPLLPSHCLPACSLLLVAAPTVTTHPFTPLPPGLCAVLMGMDVPPQVNLGLLAGGCACAAVVVALDITGIATTGSYNV